MTKQANSRLIWEETFMTVRESLEQVLQRLPDERLREVRRFAQFLLWEDERAEWQSFGRAQLARAYGDNEPEYSEADVKPGPRQ